MAKELLLEIGAEEIPASFIEPALEDLRRIFTERAALAQLPHQEVLTYGTPRRLAIAVQGVAEKSADISKEVMGPAVKAAFDAQGKPTKAAEKFAEGQKTQVDKLLRVQTPKGEYLAARVEEKGKSALSLLPDILSAAVHGINFKKSMRWGDVEFSFARPVHWIVALYGSEVIPVVLGDVKSGRQTQGHRFLSRAPIELADPSAYLPELEKAHVVADIAKRRSLLSERLEAAAKQASGKLLADEALLHQVANLVEEPHPVVGSFEEKHLDLPPEVLVQEMKSHQRYFSLTDDRGNLLPRFVAVSNTPVKDEKLSLRGYERVLRARLADARFFYDQDRQTKLESRTGKLERVVWQGQLGSYAEKVERIRALALYLAEATLGKGNAAEGALSRAAALCKADLVTGMVGEFPELQGVMGREYAKASGEPEAVAVAIYEHYLPRSAQDALPQTDAGALLGMADRLDSLAGLFAIGKAPTGAADPFGLRRAALAVIHIVTDRQYRFSLSAAFERALAALGPKLATLKSKGTGTDVPAQLLEFFRARLKALWTEKHRTDVVEAVLSSGFAEDLVGAHLRLQAFSALVDKPDFVPLAATFKRVVNIVEKQGKAVPTGQVASELLTDPAEKELASALEQSRRRADARMAQGDYSGALGEMTSLKPAVDLFFDKVMVMAEDARLRDNRIRLLREIAGLFHRMADFSKIQAEQAGR
jgi:glycyl-tRNA synthetase beta chain